MIIHSLLVVLKFWDEIYLFLQDVATNALTPFNNSWKWTNAFKQPFENEPHRRKEKGELCFFFTDLLDFLTCMFLFLFVTNVLVLCALHVLYIFFVFFVYITKRRKSRILYSWRTNTGNFDWLFLLRNVTCAPFSTFFFYFLYGPFIKDVRLTWGRGPRKGQMIRALTLLV